MKIFLMCNYSLYFLISKQASFILGFSWNSELKNVQNQTLNVKSKTFLLSQNNFFNYLIALYSFLKKILLLFFYQFKIAKYCNTHS